MSNLRDYRVHRRVTSVSVESPRGESDREQVKLDLERYTEHVSRRYNVTNDGTLLRCYNYPRRHPLPLTVSWQDYDMQWRYDTPYNVDIMRIIGRAPR